MPDGGVPFVGEGRRELLASLRDAYDEVVRSGVPQWWSLEANVGWGKGPPQDNSRGVVFGVWS